MIGLRKRSAQEKKERQEAIRRRALLAGLIALCLAGLLLAGCSGGQAADADARGGDEASRLEAPSGDETQEGAGESGAVSSSGEAGPSEPAVLPQESEAESEEPAAPAIRDLLRMGEEPRDAWIIAFDSLNVRRFCYSRGTVIGKFARGQKITVTGPARYGFYPVRGTDAETGEELRGYCSADYVSFMEYTGDAVLLDIVRYVQSEGPWQDLQLGESRYTIAQAGCTTTCFAMCESYLTGMEVTPDKMWERLTYSNEGNLYWPEEYYQDYSSDYLFKIYQKLHQGIPVLIGARHGSGGQHWVLVTGYDPKGKEITSASQLKAADFTINDPASKGRSTLAEFFRDLPYYIKFAYYVGEAQ